MNAQQEFDRHLQGVGIKVKAAAIVCSRGYYSREDGKFNTSILKENYTNEDYGIFIDSLDYSYDNGYGGQELFGYIWFVDGTWSSRGEYDGAEWWEYHKCPKIKYDVEVN